MNVMSRRVARLEESRPTLGTDFVVVSDAAEAERIEAQRGDNARSLTCIITGVPRPRGPSQRTASFAA